MDQYIKAIGAEAWNGVTEKWPMLQETIMKVIGRITKETVMELCGGLLVMKNTLETGSKICKVGLEHIFGLIQEIQINFYETGTLVTGLTV